MHIHISTTPLLGNQQVMLSIVFQIEMTSKLLMCKMCFL